MKAKETEYIVIDKETELIMKDKGIKQRISNKATEQGMIIMMIMRINKARVSTEEQDEEQANI